MTVLELLGIDMSHFFPDIPRVYTALAEWLACVQCILGVKRHLSAPGFAAVAGAMLAVQAAFLYLTSGLYGFPWFFCMAIAAALMYFFIYVCCNLEAKEAGYFCVLSFVTAEFAASLEWQIDYFFYFDMGWENPWFRLFWLLVIYGLLYMGIGLLYHRFEEKDRMFQVTGRELSATVIIGLSVFLMSNLGFVPVRTPFDARYQAEVFTIRTIIDLGGIAILYAHHVQRIDLRVNDELEKVQNILHNQYVQYQQAQEAMDIIHYKYHDLKHHILALRAEEDMGKRNAYLDKMEAEIQSYEAQNKTGNKVLDTLLTTKNLYCMKNGISMTSVVGGTLFDFMDVMDICSIFGNALDNAIECEEKIPDKEKRLIHVSAFSQKSFLIIRFENYYEGELRFVEELPMTTKGSARFHGYGLKSLRYTVHKYGGEVDVDTQQGWFSLKILIPLKQSYEKHR